MDASCATSPNARRRHRQLRCKSAARIGLGIEAPGLGATLHKYHGTRSEGMETEAAANLFVLCNCNYRPCRNSSKCLSGIAAISTNSGPPAASYARVLAGNGILANSS